MANIILNEWETAFFGRRIGQILLKNVPNRPLAPALFADFALVQAKIPAADHALLDYLQQQAFQRVTGEIQFSLPLPAQPLLRLETATQADIAELSNLFANAFPNSRFRPPYFSPAENQRFYRQWISNAVQGLFDDVCLVKRLNGQIVGGVSVRRTIPTAQIGLLAVAKLWQGKGIGTELLQETMAWAAQKGATKLIVCTQSDNFPAIHLYQRFGAIIDNLYTWLYRNAHSF